MIAVGHNLLMADGGAQLVMGMTIFAAAGLALGLGAMLFGRLLRPKLPNPVKGETYECGEVSVGSSWVQFDLRFYVVALVFLVFDVEIALLYPWAVVFGGGTETAAGSPGLKAVQQTALWDMLFFFSVLVVGFLYLWRFGYLDWVWAYGSRVEAGPGGQAAATPATTPGAETEEWSGNHELDPEQVRAGSDGHQRGLGVELGQEQ